MHVPASSHFRTLKVLCELAQSLKGLKETGRRLRVQGLGLSRVWGPLGPRVWGNWKQSASVPVSASRRG